MIPSVLAFAAAAAFIASMNIAPTRAQEATAEGEREFRARCASCHSTTAGDNRVGPHLEGVFGREAGSVEGARYSWAMSQSTLVWEEETLDAYLANPRQTVPGTSMPVGVTDARRRALVIDYLRGLSTDQD